VATIGLRQSCGKSTRVIHHGLPVSEEKLKRAQRMPMQTAVSIQGSSTWVVQADDLGGVCGRAERPHIDFRTTSPQPQAYWSPDTVHTIGRPPCCVAVAAGLFQPEMVIETGPQNIFEDGFAFEEMDFIYGEQDTDSHHLQALETYDLHDATMAPIPGNLDLLCPTVNHPMSRELGSIVAGLTSSDSDVANESLPGADDLTEDVMSPSSVAPAFTQATSPWAVSSLRRGTPQSARAPHELPFNGCWAPLRGTMAATSQITFIGPGITAILPVVSMLQTMVANLCSETLLSNHVRRFDKKDNLEEGERSFIREFMGIPFQSQMRSILASVLAMVAAALRDGEGGRRSLLQQGELDPRALYPNQSQVVVLPDFERRNIVNQSPVHRPKVQAFCTVENPGASYGRGRGKCTPERYQNHERAPSCT
jgi:hypothetical protein